jgi:hypothetical protein
MNLFKFGKIRATARCCFSAKMLWQAAIGTNLIFLTGCRGAPSINLLGSFFPGWMLCMIVYFCLWVFITLLSWLLFFRS